ncbi:hypothetical protein PG997_007864 [Apiospora hydei]|uniref:Protein kinase domain-containing protein n=1 Tax=Apiospora hydei TaxID=1337664 RepID=A0ABR1WC05_9PEZI
MAEVLGALASIVTITECISKASSLVIDYYKAPAQIEHLQKKRIQTFHDAVKALENSSGAQDSFFSQSLSSTFAVIEELDHFVTVELFQNATLSSRARRTAWLRGKSKISRLLQKLEDAQSILRVALDVSQLNSRQHVESTLAVIRQCAASTQETSIMMERRIQNLERQLGSFKESAEHINQTPLSSTTRDSVNSLALSFIGSEPGDTPPPMIVSHRAQLSCLVTNEEGPDSSGEGHGVPDHRGATFAAIASPFELSSSFFPETYTSMAAAPSLISYDFASVHDTSYARISRCSAFYSPSPRKWLRITLLITTSVDSPYWNLVCVNAVDTKWGNEGWVLPKRLNASIEGSLGAFDDLRQDSEISLYLGPPHGSAGTYQSPKLRLETTNASVSIKTSLLEATKMVHHWYCPRYPETDIVKRTLTRRSKQSGSIACIGSKWTIMTQFTACQTDFDVYLYNMQISHYFHNTPGISRLLGLVYNQEDGYLTGYLSEMAPTPFLYLSRPFQAQSTMIPWKRREKKCWQIVCVVTSLHNSGFLVGTMTDPIRSFIGTDSNDDFLCRALFDKRFYYNENTPFLVPPECRSEAIFDSTRRYMPASPSTDLYQLGFMLWRVANGLEVVLSSTLCGLAGCSTSPDKLCREPHADPARLPSLHHDVPEYISEIIEICRSADPASREPAWRLLERFPSTTDRGWIRTKKIIHNLWNLMLGEMPDDTYDSWYTCVGADGKRDQRLLPDL